MLIDVMTTVQGDHFSGNVREFNSCPGSARKNLMEKRL